MKRDMTVVRCDNIKCDHNERGICQLEEEPALTTKELQKWNVKIEKTLQKNFRYHGGINLNLTDSEKRRWVRSRIRKENPKLISEERLERCRTLIRAGNSTYNICKVVQIGYSRVTELRKEMRDQNH